MKFFLKPFLLLMISIFVISCETDNPDSTIESEIELFDSESVLEKRINDPECTRISGDLSSVCFTGQRTYSVIHPFGSQAAIRWSIRSGSGFSIDGLSTSTNVTISFDSNFRGGELQVVVGNCISILQLGVCNGGIQCSTNVAPKRPGPITFDIFLGSRPTYGDFCVNTVANALWISNVDCAVDYEWTINPSPFGTKLTKSPVHPGTALLEVQRSGTYTVSVRAIGSTGLKSAPRSISLVAENCNGGIGGL